MAVLPNVGYPELIFKLNVVYGIQDSKHWGKVGCGVFGRDSIG
jgi:hypothetical protein